MNTCVQISGGIKKKKQTQAAEICKGRPPPGGCEWYCTRSREWCSPQCTDIVFEVHGYSWPEGTTTLTVTHKTHLYIYLEFRTNHMITVWASLVLHRMDSERLSAESSFTRPLCLTAACSLKGSLHPKYTQNQTNTLIDISPCRHFKYQKFIWKFCPWWMFHFSFWMYRYCKSNYF